MVVVDGGGGADNDESDWRPAPALSLAKIAGSREHESEGAKERMSECAEKPDFSLAPSRAPEKQVRAPFSHTP